MKEPQLISHYIAFTVFALFTLMLLYQSWMNLIRGKNTRFSLDTLALVYLRIFHGKDAIQKARRLFEEPRRIRIKGLWAFIAALSGIYYTIKFYLEYIMTK